MFEGMDGVGKTTQLTLAKDVLTQQGWLVESSRSLGGTPIGEALRSVLLQPLPRPPMTDLHIAAADQEALIEAMKLQRSKDCIILHDRGPLSIAAYQIYGDGIDESIGWSYVEAGISRLAPDLIIIYECDPEIALRRIKKPGLSSQDFFESKPLDYFKKVANGYAEAAKRYKAVVINANQPVDQVRQATMQHINALLK